MVLLMGRCFIPHVGWECILRRLDSHMISGGVCARVFLVPDELPGERKSEATVFQRPGDAGPAGLMLKRLPGEVVCAGGGSGVGSPLPRDMCVQPVTRLGAECDVFGREVQVQPDPRGICSPSGAYSNL